MNPLLKRLARTLLPKAALRRLLPLWNWYASRRLRTARTAFERAPRTPEWLDPALLPTLHRQYPPPPAYGSDAHSYERRGAERAAEVLAAIPDSARAVQFLELGCWDGMASLCLQRQGKAATAVDITDAGFDPRAHDAGVTFAVMDAARMTLPDQAFDAVFTYNAFEHFADPAAVLGEIHRVLKPGGYAYANFGPIYTAPMGLHAYHQISVPYCQYLFPREVLVRYAEEQGLGALPFDEINYWSVAQFRALWRAFADRFDTVLYTERLETWGLDLVRRYPSCFRSKTDDFDNLVVSAIEIVLRRR
jgi:2-polyprenyl-6-hydroxyphenyl methylase/3-demethylubiquinone-9 3-methyltransferase